MKEQKVIINLLSSHQLQEQMKPEEIETIYHGKPTDSDILTVETKKGIKHFCDEVDRPRRYRETVRRAEA